MSTADADRIRERISLDPEARAIGDCAQALEPLDSEARLRAMRYLADRFGVDVESLHRD